jgi:TP901 family phage tail tape measure protein
MRTARAQVSEFSRELDKSEKKKQALTTLGNAAGAVGAAAAFGLGAAVKASADFDKAMSSVEAATHGSAKTMDSLRNAALKAGAETAFSATEAAGGIEALSKAGVSTNDILRGGLRGALDLAAAGQMDVADAAESAATAMTMFGLSGSDVPHVADLLAAAAGKAQGEVSDFSAALNQSGLVANQTGLSIEETTGALAAFASQGLIGSDAGTSLKTMLQSLTPASEKAEQAMEDYGISAYDAQGNFVGLTEWAGRLQKGLGDMSAEQRNATLKTVFGSDAVRAASVIYEQGAQGIGKWISKVNDSGFAAETAKTKLDNLYGDLEALKGSLETALIGTGSGAQGPLRTLVQNLTDVVNAFNKLPQPVKDATGAFMGLVAVAGGATFLGTRFLTSISTARTALTDLGLTADRTGQKLNMRNMAIRGGAGMLGGMVLAFNSLDDSADRATRTMGAFANIAGGALMGFAVGGPIGAAIGGGVSAIGALVGALGDSESAAKRAAQGAEEYKTTLDQTTGAITDQTKALIRNRLEQDGVLAAAEKLGLDTGLMVDAIAGGSHATTAFNRDLATLETRVYGVKGGINVLGGAVDGTTKPLWQQVRAVSEAGQKYGHLVPALKNVKGAYNVESRAIDQARASTERKARADSDSADTTKQHSKVVEESADKIDDETQALRANIRAHNARSDQLLALIDKEVAWEQSLDDAAKEARKGTKTLNTNTQAGRDNITALGEMAAAWNALPDKTKRAEGGIREARQEFIKIAMQMGASREQAERLAQKLLDIPNPKRKVDVDTEGARREVDSFTGWFNGVMAHDLKDETVKINVESSILKLAAQGQGPIPQAAGGPVPLAGGRAGKDSVHVLAMPDEHMWTTAEVKAAGGGNAKRGHSVLMAMRRMALRGELTRHGDLQPFAAGGPVVRLPVHEDTRSLAQVIGTMQSSADVLATAWGKALSKRITELYAYGGGRPLGPGGSLSQGQVVMGQRFAQAQVGKPYIWGGVGPAGYDCSGFQSAIFNAAVGRNPYQRIGSTGTMPWPGMSGGPGLYSIGWFTGSPGHMSGNIGGLNVESSGGVGAHVGSTARSPMDSMFNGLAHFDSGGRLRPGWTLAHNGTGRDEYVHRFRGGAGASSRPAPQPQVIDARMRITNWQQGWAQVRLEMQDSIDSDHEFAATVGRMSR